MFTLIHQLNKQISNIVLLIHYLEMQFFSRFISDSSISAIERHKRDRIFVCVCDRMGKFYVKRWLCDRTSHLLRLKQQNIQAGSTLAGETDP
jgi:hypothetical protein